MSSSLRGQAAGPEADASSQRKAKNRADGKRRGGMVLIAWQRKTTRRDLRALKGAKNSGEAVASGDPAMHGTAPNRTPKTDRRARVTTQAKDVTRGLANLDEA
jgi:hypothetical protein